MLVLLDARQRQKIVDQAAHAVGLLGHDAEEALARRGIVARRPAQGLDEAGDAGDRRPELVAGVGDEIGAHALGAAQRRGVVQHDQRQRAVGRRARQAPGMGDDVELGRARQHDLDRDSGRARRNCRRPVSSSESIADRSSDGAAPSTGRGRRRRAEQRHAPRGWCARCGAGGRRAISGSGRPSTMACADAARLSIEARWRRQPVDECRRRRGELLGGRREGQARHHRLLLARQFADEAGEARQRAEIALHQDGGDHRDAGKGDQGRTAGQIARPVKAAEGDGRRRQRHQVGGEVAAERKRLVGHAGDIIPQASAVPVPIFRGLRRSSKRCSTVKNDGTNSTARQVEAIMPLNTQRPSEMRAVGARAGRHHQRHDAQDEGEGGHQDRAEAGPGRLDRRLDDRLAVDMRASRATSTIRMAFLAPSAISSIRPIWV